MNRFLGFIVFIILFLLFVFTINVTVLEFKFQKKQPTQEQEINPCQQ